MSSFLFPTFCDAPWGPMTKSVSKVCQCFIVSVTIISTSGAQRVPLVPATWRADRTKNCRSAWAAQPCPFKRRALVCSSSVAGNAIQSFTWSRHRPSKLADNGVPSLPGHSLTLNKVVGQFMNAWSAFWWPWFTPLCVFTLSVLSHVHMCRFILFTESNPARLCGRGFSTVFWNLVGSSAPLLLLPLL